MRRISTATRLIVSLLVALVPVVLVWYLLVRSRERGLRALGFDLSQPRRDLARGALLAAVVARERHGRCPQAQRLTLTAPRHQPEQPARPVRIICRVRE